MAQLEERSDVVQSRDDESLAQRGLKGRRWRQLFGVLQRKFRPQVEESQPPVCQTDPAFDRRPQTVLFPDAAAQTTPKTDRREDQEALQWSRPHSEANSSSSVDSAFVSAVAKEDPSGCEQRHRHSPGLSIEGGDQTRRTSDDGEHSAESSASTPMSNLLLRAERMEAGGGGGGGGRRRGSSAESSNGAAKPSLFGVSEFLALYRSRAYSDPRPTDVQRAAAFKLKSERRKSDCLTHSTNNCSASPDDSGEAAAASDATDPRSPHSSSSSSSSSSSTRKRNSQNIAMDVPDTIPEHREASFFGESTAAVVVSSKSPRATNDNNNNDNDNESTSTTGEWGSDCGGGSVGGRMGRRRQSEPPIPNARELTLLSSCFAKAEVEGHRVRCRFLSERSFKDEHSKRTEVQVSAESLGIDPPLLSRHRLIVWKDSASTQVLQLPESVEVHDALQEAIADDENAIYVQLMKMHTCSELMPNSSTVVLLDAHVKVITAFYAMIRHGIKSTPLWDSESMRIVGMLTVTDFIKILQLYRNSPEDLKGLEDEKVSSLKEKLGCSGMQLAHVNADDSIFEAVRALAAHRMHRLPVIDAQKNDILYFLNNRRILQFICLFMASMPFPSFMSQSIGELGVGTFESVVSIGVDRPLHEALELLLSLSVSSLPVIDDQNRVINVFSKSDVMSLAEARSYQNLNVTVGDVVFSERECFEGVYLCKRTDVLSQIVEWLIKTQAHRLIVVDDDRSLRGVVSVSDVVQFLVLHPPPSPPPHPHHPPTQTTTTCVSNDDENIDEVLKGEIIEQTSF